MPTTGRSPRRASTACWRASAPAEKAVHLCFGNYGGQTIQQGDYEKLIAFLNALEADHVVLEMARRPRAELAMLQRRQARTWTWASA